MCLAVPGRIAAIINDDDDDDCADHSSLTRRGVVDFGGVRKQVNLALVPEVEIGDYVLVHVGFAMSRIDEREAERVFTYLAEVGAVEDA